jgi:predicted hotdog family 3-hydroxylacyl-ACP dehydratase
LRSHFDRVIAWTPKSAAICSNVTPSGRARGDPDDVLAELFGIGLGHGGILSARLDEQGRSGGRSRAGWGSARSR